MGGTMLAVWAAIASLAATLVGAVAGALTWWETRNTARALLVAGGAIGGALGLAIAAGALVQQAR